MDTIHVSIGTATVLDLSNAPLAIAPTTAYLMLGGRCVMNCAFCAQARDSEASELALSRVIWPPFALDAVCGRLAEAEKRGALRRCCIQVTAGSEAYRDTLEAVRAIHSATALPLDVALLPASLDQVAELVTAGVDHIGFGLDAACQRVFEQVKGGHWAHVVRMIEGTARQFPGRAAVHLIVGLGETEQELVERIEWACDLGVPIGLFAFTPVKGTLLADHPPPSLAQYRRMQAAHWLIVRHGVHADNFAFSANGTLIDIHRPAWPTLLADGEAFRTCGCPDCNRPFYNERPGGTIYNYARPLTAVEAARALDELELRE
ncbi:MAG: radical SAM protein [Anaerolineae bacterium]|nr:radical SAM protein [Anaerolineae bacterium]